MLRSRRPTTRPFSLAVAGTGSMATVHRLAADAAGIPVVVVAGETSASVAATTDAGARACAYTDLPAGADAVVVATAPARHAELALQAVGAGVPVLVETPLARTLVEADRIVDAERAGAVVVYGESLLLAPAVIRALALLAGQGALHYVEARALSPRPDRDHPLDPHRGGGVLFELAVHPIALVLVLAAGARPTEVVADLVPADDSAELLDDDAVVRVRFDTGMEARIEASWRHVTPVWDVQASGADVVVRADLLPTVGLEHNGEPVDLPAGPADVDPHLVDLGYVEMLRRLRAGPGRGTPGAELGRAVLEVVSAAYASAAAGGPVALPFAGPRDRSPIDLWRS